MVRNMKKATFFLVLFLLLVSCQGEKPQQLQVETKVPQWAKAAIWYQIFPERFWNGDSTNDPQPEDMEGAWPYFTPPGWQNSPWTSDWFKLQPWEQRVDMGFYQIAGMRRYGGDLQGVLDRLDYLQNLGITAIYFNPLFESPSHHKYDATYYHHIDNNFGPNPQRDREIWAQEDPADPATWQWTTADSLFLKLIRECHRRGIRVIIDGVFNHVGATFWAFRDVVKNQQQSPFKDWFIIKRWDDPRTPENEFEYQGWYGVKDLPELREDENGLVEPVREHIRAVVQRWGDPNGDGDPSDGIDGWRLDVAEMVKIGFWRDFRRWVKEINPDAYLTGEVWWENWRKNKMFNAAPWLQGDVFDAVMNYRFARAVKRLIIDRKIQISVQAFVDSLQAIYHDYPRENVYVLMNLMDSHDVDRLASQIVNPDRWYDHDANPGQNPQYDVRKPTRQERRKQKLIVALQMTLPGAPMIYYGDEAGMWGGDDPDCRKPMVWPELQYEPETHHPLGKERPHDAVKFERPLFNCYKKLIHIRRDNPVLSTGDIEFFLIDNEKKMLGFTRSKGQDKIWVILNNNPNRLDYRVHFQEMGKSFSLLDLVTGKRLEVKNGTGVFSFKPYQFYILKRPST